MEVCFAIII